MARYWTAAETHDPEWLQLVATGENPWADAGELGGCAHVSAKIDPACWVDADVEVWNNASVGRGTWIHEGAVVCEAARIGQLVDVRYDSTVGTNAEIGDSAFIGSRVQIGARAQICRGAHIGSDARIGSRATVTDYVRIEGGAWVLCDDTV